MDNLLSMWIESCKYVDISCSNNSRSGVVEGRMASSNFTCSDSLLTECMPQLSSLFPTSVQYDCSVPADIFSDQVSSEASNHSADSIETIARSLSRNIHSSEVINSRRVRQDSFNVFGLDDGDSVFSSGIAADDMCSLLEQFEEASQSLDSFDLDFPKSVSEPSTRVTSPVIEHTTELNDLEVVKLLKTKNPLQGNQVYPQSQGSFIPSSVTNSVFTSPKKLSTGTRPTSCIPQLSSTVISNGEVRVSANYYREIQDHDYCSNVPHKVSKKPPVQLLSSDKEVNPEGSMLKSLLINSELMEKMKEETMQRKASSSSNKSAEDLPMTNTNTGKSDIGEVTHSIGAYQAVQDQVHGIDFEQLIDSEMKKSTSLEEQHKSSISSLVNSENVISKVPTLPSFKAVRSTANVQKKTFTLDELIAKDMKRKAVEKAQLAAILQTAPRSNTNTPKTSPYQSPRKSDSPKLPELPGLDLIKPLNIKPSTSRGSSKEPSPMVSPMKPMTAVKKEEKPVIPSKKVDVATNDIPKNQPSRERTDSKCLDVVDMDLDDSMDDALETSSVNEIKQKQLDTAREIVNKASELVKAIVNAPRLENNCTSKAFTAGNTTAENQCQVESEMDESVQQDEASNEPINSEPTQSVELSEQIEEELYEAAMDLDIHPQNDDYFHDDEDSCPFEAVQKTDLNDNTPYQADMAASWRAPENLPLNKDPLGLESSEVPTLFLKKEDFDCTQPAEPEPKPEVKKSSRNYRKRDTNEEPEHAVFDKLPTYCRLLTVPNKYPQKGEIKASKLVDSSIPDRDRDPSPNRNDPMYNKVPSYFSNFANSTKYDDSYERSASCNSSRCHTPTNLVIAGSTSRPTSRPVSRESTPPKAYKTGGSSSRSSSCSTCSSNSSDGYSSRSRSRSRRRLTERSNRRRSDRSRSGRSRRSRFRSRSRSRSPINRRHQQRGSRSSSHSSSDYSRSRSRSRHRDRRRRGERRRERRRQRSESLDRQWREREGIKDKRKSKQIEERRIVYVGRISPNLTRRELRVQFEQFGEVEETSVHLRESGGDPYGFVTFSYTCDAFAAIENGHRCKGLEKYDLCFGGRRQFCKESYADLDGNAEEEEEMAPVMPKQGGDLDFDALLKQTQKMLRKKKDSS